MGVPEHKRCITWHGGGLAATRGQTAPINQRTGRNQPKEPTYNRLMSRDPEFPCRGAVDQGRSHLVSRPHLASCPHALHRPSLPIFDG
jgi:hypothetical protein